MSLPWCRLCLCRFEKWNAVRWYFWWLEKNDMIEWREKYDKKTEEDFDEDHHCGGLVAGSKSVG